MQLIDTHAHLYWRKFDGDREAVLQSAREAGVQQVVIPGTNVHSSTEARDLCRAHSGLFFAAGIHPSDTAEDGPEARRAIEDLCRDPQCVAVGEAGLDFFHKSNPAREVQEACLRWQIGLALELDKPLIIHTRNAHDETLALLSEYPGLRGVMHCFTMGPLEMRAYADLGLYLSYSGVLTYPANAENREAARLTPADRILIETDSPFLPPQPERGKRNEPAFVRYVLDTLAEVLGESPESLAERTSANARALFGLPCV